MPDPTELIEKAKEKGGNFVSEILSSPFRFVKGLLSAPFSAIGGVGKGIFSKTIGNPFGVLMTGGFITLMARFMPSLLVKLPGGEKMAHDMQDGGWPAVVKDALIAGVAVQGGIGAITGGLSGVVDGASNKDGIAEKTGGVLGALATVGGLGYLIYKAVDKHDNADDKSKITYTGSENDGLTKTPGMTPKTTSTGKVNTLS